MNVVLIGFMCSGKSIVGRALAEKWGWNHVDTDEMISKDVGLAVPDIIRKKGEPAFREVERKAVQLVSLLDRTVISTGGGVPLDPGNRAALEKNGVVVWLQVSPRAVLERAGALLKNRPLIDAARPLESIEERMSVREPVYALARHAVATDGRTLESVVDEVAQLVSMGVS
jgi:shikimate kinase